MTKCHSNENVLLSEMMNYKYVYMFINYTMKTRKHIFGTWEVCLYLSVFQIKLNESTNKENKHIGGGMSVKAAHYESYSPFFVWQ